MNNRTVLMSITEARHTTEFSVPRWSAAEFLDIPYADGTILRAVICRLSPGKWQSTILCLSGDSGEVISTTLSKTAAEAHEIAASELDKCIHDPMA
jgi:hypothetical protein